MAAAMPDAETAPDDQAEGGAEEAGDLSQGYCLELSVLPDGTFKVSGPEPLAEEADEEQGEAAGSEAGQDFTSIGEALKAILSAIKANPVGGSDQSQFEAGYGAG